MGKLYYCTECKRVFKSNAKCEYCNAEVTKELEIGTPVSVIGTKLKGNVLKIMVDAVALIVRDQSNNKMIKEFEIDKLKKVL